MKRKLLTVLCIIMTAGMLLSCGADNDDWDSDDVETSQESTRKRDKDSKKDEDNEDMDESESNTEDTDKETEKAPAEIPTLRQEGSIEETVLYEDKGLKITATDIEYASSYLIVNLLLENNSEKDYSFIAGSMGYGANSINGYMIDGGYFNEDIAAGKKAYSEARFSLDELKMCGISQVAEIQIAIEIKEADSYDRDDYIFPDPCKLRIIGTEGYDVSRDTYREIAESGALASINNNKIIYYSDDVDTRIDGVTVLSETVLQNRDGEYLLLLEVQNDTEKIVRTTMSNVRVNNLMVLSRDWSGDLILPGCRKILDLPMSDVLDANIAKQVEIEKIGKITVDLEIEDQKRNQIGKPATVDVMIDEKDAIFPNSGEAQYDVDGIKLISKGIVGDTYEYSDNLHWLVIVENQSDQTITVEEDMDTLSLNGFMIDCIVYPVTVEPGCLGLLDVVIWDHNLEEIKISSASEIEEAEMAFEITHESWKVFANPKISVEFNE